MLRLGQDCSLASSQVPCVGQCGHQREYPNPMFYHIQRWCQLCELPQHSPTCLRQLLTSASSTAATVIAATNTTIAGTIQSTHRNRPLSVPTSCFQPPSTAIFDVLWWCSIHVPRLQLGQSTHSISSRVSEPLPNSSRSCTWQIYPFLCSGFCGVFSLH